MRKPWVAVLSAVLVAVIALTFQYFINTSPDGSAGHKNLIGLIVKYKAGVKVIAADGTPTGSNKTNLDLKAGPALGRGYQSLRFVNPTTLTQAERAAAKLRLDPRVQIVTIDKLLPVVQLGRQPITAGLQPIYDLAKASAPRSLLARDGFLTAYPNRATVILSWLPPRYLYGSRVVGYKIMRSANGGLTYQTVVSNTGTTSAKLTLKTGMFAGVTYRFKVAALSRFSTGTRTGASSLPVTIIPTTVPDPPVFLGSRIATTTNFPSWAKPTYTQAGGLPIRYTALALSPGLPAIPCQTTNQTCVFAGLISGIRYSVSLTAINLRGATVARNPIPVNDSYYNQEWHLDGPTGINTENAWPVTTGSSSVVVAVIDTGITSHPDLDGQVLRNTNGSFYGFDFVSDSTVSNDGDGWDSNPTDPGDYDPATFDSNDPSTFSSWHGTSVAGAVAATKNNIGILGVAPSVKILPVRVLSSHGSTVSDLIAALNWSAGFKIGNGVAVKTNIHPADVINLSIGTEQFEGCDSATTETIAAVRKSGVTVVSAAGNSNVIATTSYPGNCDGTINVAATGYTGDRAAYSNWGIGVDISAPGGDAQNPDGAPDQSLGDVVVLINDGESIIGNPGYALLEGTSLAAPVVSGVVALLYSVDRTISPDEVLSVLQNTAQPFGTTTECGQQPLHCGIGIVDAGVAVALAQARAG